MSILSNKFNIKQNDTIYACECYTDKNEAIPTGGNFLEVKNNGVSCYIGLQVVGKTEFDTPLQIKKDNIIYNIQSKVINTRKVSIKQTDNQTIFVNYNGLQYTDDFIANVGEPFTVEVIPNKGYIAGIPNIQSGNISAGTDDFIISASPASKAQYQITIEPTDHQTIQVTCNDQIYTSTFQADYGSNYEIKIIPDEGYIAGQLVDLETTGTITNNMTISVTDAEIIKYTIYVIQPEDSNSNITINSQIITESLFNYGTNITVQVNLEYGYSIDSFYMGDFPIFIEQQEHQTIKVIVNQTEEFTDDFVITPEDTYEIQIIPDEGYVAGSLIDIPITGKFSNITTIKATAPETNEYIYDGKYGPVSDSETGMVNLSRYGKDYIYAYT